MVEPTTSRERTGGWLTPRRIALCATLALLIAVPFAAPAIGYPSLTALTTRILILGIAALSLNLALGYGGLVSFGHAAFYGVGGYAVGLLTQSLASRELLFGILPGSDQMLITLPAAMIAGGVFAAVIGALSLRTSGVQFIMITLAFAQMLFFLFVSLKAIGGGDGLIIRRRNELPLIDARDNTAFYFVVLTIFVLWSALLARIVHSRFGRALDGLRQNARRMAAIGVPATPTRWAAFTISGVGAGLAGGLMTNFLRFASPDMMHWTQSGEFLIMAILGGVGTLFGPAVGAMILIVLETALAGWTEHWQFILGPILILIVLFGRNSIGRLASMIAGSRHE